MSKPRRSLAKPKSVLPSDYSRWLSDLKLRIRTAQIKAALSANRELIALYWDLGHAILRAQREEGWGAKVIERLAVDLRAEFPEMSGFSRANLLFMRAFAEAWSPIVLQPVRQLDDAGAAQPLAGNRAPAKVQQPVRQLPEPIEPQAIAQFPVLPPEPIASLPWGHNLVLLHKLKDHATRLWYASAALEHGWSRAVLTVQIETKAHERSGKALTNFARTLPPMQSDFAQQVLKDPYTFDFLTIAADARERELEQGLVEHIQKFLLELGVGFAFVGRQVHLEVASEDYYLDLLFYHLKLRCFVVIDLKMEPFKPEFAGKMNFYLSAVDDQMRAAADQPTIGLLLCKDKQQLTVEYALRDLAKPIGVAGWKTRLVESLPKKLRGVLPTIEELEKQLTNDRPR